MHDTNSTDKRRAGVEEVGAALNCHPETERILEEAHGSSMV